ncbi:MAG: hypothetical protein AB1634_12660 [Thermodesulfobacteriota bacterium]
MPESGASEGTAVAGARPRRRAGRPPVGMPAQDPLLPRPEPRPASGWPVPFGQVMLILLVVALLSRAGGPGGHDLEGEGRLAAMLEAVLVEPPAVGPPAATPVPAQLLAMVRRALDQEMDDERAAVELVAGSRLRIEFDHAFLFVAGSVALNPAGDRALARLGRVLAAAAGPVLVVAQAGEPPLAIEAWTSPLELAAGRAARAATATGLPAGRLTAATRAAEGMPAGGGFLELAVSLDGAAGF